MDNSTFNFTDDINYSTQNTQLLQICPGDSLDRCYTKYAWKFLVAALNFSSILVNVLHIALLHRVTALRGSTYLFILQLISIADIYATLNVLACFCSFHKLFLGEHVYYAAALAAIKNHAGLVRFDTLAVASLERYLSICYPLLGTSYCDRYWSRNSQIKWTAAFFWIASLAISFASTFVFDEELCMDPMFGPSTTSLALSVSRLLYTSYVLFLTLLMLFCHINTMRQLQSMGRLRNRRYTQDRTSTQAAYYILIINVMYYVCLIPAVLVIIIQSNTQAYIDTIGWVIYALYSCYGILNVVVYGWRTNSYRTVAQNIFSRNRITPTDNQQNNRIAENRVANCNSTYENNRRAAPTFFSVQRHITTSPEKATSGSNRQSENGETAKPCSINSVS